MLTIRLDSPVPLNDQLVAGIRALIAGGEIRPGDELPPVRQLAADLGVNLNTVARAYRELESDGLVSTARGRGTHVTASVERGGEGAIAQRARIAESLRTVMADAKLAGIGEDEVRALTESALRTYWNDRTLTDGGSGGGATAMHGREEEPR